MILLNNGLLYLKIAENGNGFSVDYEGKVFNSLDNSYYLRGEEKVCFSSLDNTTTYISDEKCVGIKFDYSVFTTKIWSERFSTKIHFEIEEKASDFDFSYLCWPSAISLAPENKGYTVLPVMQGMIIPDNSDDKVYPLFEKRILSREATMPWWGQTGINSGYMTVIETPFDAEYNYSNLNSKKTEINVAWLPSFGKIGYTRKLTIDFNNQHFGYVEMCKKYREYLIKNNELKLLEEKGENILRLLGAPVIYTPPAKWHCEEESDYYNKENPAENDRVLPFAEMADSLKKIYNQGIRNAYVHLDGWINGGYDNLHPFVFPPNKEAGGVAGLYALKNKCHDLGYLLAYHDQYRDYYLKSPDYIEDNVVTYNGNIVTESTIWPGGRQAVLCATKALDFIKRNYRLLEENRILPDGAYLDVFSVIEADECHNPLHKMTRKECVENRCKCLSYISDLGLIRSSEEITAKFVPYLDIVHHSPYVYAFFEHFGRNEFGIPVPLLNLVYHDCIFVPWNIGKNVWGLPKGQSGFLHGMLNGGLPASDLNIGDNDIPKISLMSKLNKEVGLSQMLVHTFLSDDYSTQKTVFATGTEVTVDFKNSTYSVLWADGTIVEGGEE